jgi:hypothetical protein
MTTKINNAAARSRKTTAVEKTEANNAAAGSDAVEPQVAIAPQPEKPASKSVMVLALLERPEGATLDQLVAATGWLPHTTRAALTGFRKKGHVVESLKPSDDPRVYRVTGKAVAP